jgi:glycosyltransferase involved in cell wall biosynthesis
MKVLLSAYACEPDKGSEPGIGWNWALEIARLGHKVWVLTKANNQPSINCNKLSLPERNNIEFLYYDLPGWSSWWKRGSKRIHLYYILWQFGAYHFVKKINNTVKFNLVHHITFGTFRFPSFMCMLGVPYILGPVGGGETAPLKLRFKYPIKGLILDFTRDFFNFLAKFDFITLMNFRIAGAIYVKTPETLEKIPKRYRQKAKLQIEIGTDVKCTHFEFTKGFRPLRLIYAGRFIYWKGMHYGLLAFAMLSKLDSRVRLTMVGEGPDKKNWKKLVKKLDIDDKVSWTGWVPHKKIDSIYSDHDVLLFPSLHDSSGTVILEAMSHAMPVVCLKIGGPGVLVNSSCGFAIPVKNTSMSAIIERLAKALIELNYDIKLRNRLRSGALLRTKQFSWSASVSGVYKNFNV